MYVCVCNAVTDRQIRTQSQCPRTRGTVAEIYRALGARVQCGKCVPTARSIIDGSRPQACDNASMQDFECPQMPTRDDISIPSFDGMQMPARPGASVPAFAMAE
jgi:bacterioferritin-associated ferredoxin